MGIPMHHIGSVLQGCCILLRRVAVRCCSGLTSPAHLAALPQALVDLIWVLLVPVLFLAVYYYILLPEMSFGSFYVAALGVCWWMSGLAYLVSALVPARSALMTGESVLTNGFQSSMCDLACGSMQGVPPSTESACPCPGRR